MKFVYGFKKMLKSQCRRTSMCVHHWVQVGYSTVVRRPFRQMNLNGVKWGTHDEIGRPPITLGTANERARFAGVIRSCVQEKNEN